MKRFLLLALLINASALFAQQEPKQLWNNFYKSGSNQLYWQQISETTLDIDGLVKAIKLSGYYEDVEAIENQVVCKLRAYNVPYKSYGFSTTGTPLYITNSMLTATTVFELKDNRMRSTVKNIAFIINNVDAFGHGMTKTESFEEWVLNSDHEIRDSFFMDGSNILNQDFTVKTTFEKADSNW